MTDRRCGACTLCCKLLSVRELDKPANTRCQYQSHKGCAIYHRPGFPISCELWNCAWLAGEPGLPRPDHAGWVVDIVPDMIVAVAGAERIEVQVTVVWVAPGVDPIDDPRLRRFAEREGERGRPLLLRYGSARAKMVFPPATAADGEWHIIDHDRTTIVPTQTGNLLLERAAQILEHSAPGEP